MTPRVLIVGCGNIAGGFDRARPNDAPPLTHAGGYARHGGFALTACVEPDRGRREAFMQRWSVPLGYASMEEALAAGTRADVVSICSPTASHSRDALSALRMSPQLLFCEKPATESAQETRQLMACCADAGVRLAVNYSRRWDPEVLRLAAELRSGAWGTVRSVSGVYCKGVQNNGSHLIDLLHLLLGRLELRQAGPAVHDALPHDPSVPAVLRVPGGALVQLACGHAADYALFELRLVTEKGVIEMEDGGLAWRLRTAAPSAVFEGYRTLQEEKRHPGGLEHAMLRAVAEIHRVVSDGAGVLSSTGANALEAQQLCEAMCAMARSQS